MLVYLEQISAGAMNMKKYLKQLRSKLNIQVSLSVYYLQQRLVVILQMKHGVYKTL